MPLDLKEVLSQLRELPPDARKEVEDFVHEVTKHMRWVPNPGPQTLAAQSAADWILFGGEPGGGKTQLGLGLAFNEHNRTLVIRKQYTDLDQITEWAIEINGSRKGFNGSAPPSLRFDGGKIDFGALTRDGDEQRWMGRPHDFLFVDEATQCSLKQIKFLRGWLRSTNPDQRLRTLLATNPPLSAEGLWVFDFFAAWLNPQHPNPAKPGELRWYITDENDKDQEVSGPGTFEIDGREYESESRTFIPSKFTDNPQYDEKTYRKKLDALDAETRKILMGGFRASFKDQVRQTIPTRWIELAQERWREHHEKRGDRPPHGVPQCAMGVDCTGGGTDPMVIAIRHDGWYAPLVQVEGSEIPIESAGRTAGGIVVSYRKHNSVIVVDMGGGYGGPIYENLRQNIPKNEVIAYKGAEKTSHRTREKTLGFPNVRSAAHWAFREALDPEQPGGSPIMLPDNDSVLVADLTATTFEYGPRGIEIESKEDVVARLKRSTNRSDAVIQAWWSGPKMATHYHEWQKYGGGEHGSRRRKLEVDLGPRHRNRR